MKNTIAAFAFVSLFVIASAAPPSVVDITQNDLEAAIANKSVTLLDANGSASYREGHIPGAIDFFAHKDEIAKLLPADKNALIVAYCANVHCPLYRQAASTAIDLGYTNVKHFAPGIQGWRDSGAKIEKN